MPASALVNLLDGRTQTTGTPSVTLTSPSNGGTVSTATPNLDFSGTTSTGDQNITYELQLDTSSSFNSQVGTPAFVQQTIGEDNTGGTGSVSIAYTSNTTAGNMLYAVIGQNSAAAHITTFQDTAGNTWTQVFQGSDSSDNTVTTYVAYNCLGGANTVSFSDSGYASTMVIGEVSGLATAAAYDQHTTSDAAGTSVSGRPHEHSLGSKRVCPCCGLCGHDITIIHGRVWL